MKNQTSIFPLTLILIVIPFILNAQIELEFGSGVTPNDMVAKICGEGVLFDNIYYQGTDSSSGLFSNGNASTLGLESGVFLTSGSGNNIPGPNNFTSAGTGFGGPGHPLLDSLFPFLTNDASVLEFDFSPESNIIEIRFVFGSEEYNEYVGSGIFEDVFGIFISGSKPEGDFYDNQNIALVPDSNVYIGTNTINNGWSPDGVVPTGPCTNCEYFIDNTNGLSLQYDGYTSVMTASVQVIPCQIYHLIIGVADGSLGGGDQIFDSGVFIEENSISSPPPIEVISSITPAGTSENFVEGCVEAAISFVLPNSEYTPYTLHWDLSESMANPSQFPPGDFLEKVPDSIFFPEGIDSAAIHIIPMDDGILEGEESLTFIIENTLVCIPEYDTVTFFIDDYIELSDTISPPTIICEGMEVDLSMNVFNGYPPYSYLWEPGGFTTDTIMVGPDSTTTYFVTFTDMCQETGMDSATVIVFPVCDFETFYFEPALNPGLPYSIYGELSNDTVLLALPASTNLSSLIASFTTDMEACILTVNGVIQESGVTVNDFTEPLVYHFWAPGGCFSEWTVITDIEVGENEPTQNNIQIFPNPANDLLTVIMDQPCELSIFNSLGHNVFDKHVGEGKLSIEVSELNAGIYFLQLKNDRGFDVRKLIIRR
ncbi:MAG: T9SS type A sorting domain-containing protein [Bacteroidales bacterium]|nr:T9SS type A sorting domain-containing protein [Bacteroidales bacterium]MCF8403033.1 T9SS type A sorting domain-containing protein [Bacteroidales bacterium]